MVLLFVGEIRLDQELVIEVVQTLDIRHGSPCLSG
jgi:hypothetical protein